MSTITNTGDLSPKKSKNYGKEAASVLGSYATYLGVNGLFKVVTTKKAKTGAELFNNNKLERMTPEFAENIFNSSKLPKRGIKLINTAVNPTNLDNMTSFMEMKNEALKMQVEAGLNAYYNPEMKNVIIDSTKIDTALFHEMGHGLNYTGKGVGRLLSLCRNSGTILLPIILAIAAIRKPKDKKEESTTFVGKSLDFIKNSPVYFPTSISSLTASSFLSLDNADIANLCIRSSIEYSSLIFFTLPSKKYYIFKVLFSEEVTPENNTFLFIIRIYHYL